MRSYTFYNFIFLNIFYREIHAEKLFIFLYVSQCFPGCVCHHPRRARTILLFKHAAHSTIQYKCENNSDRLSYIYVYIYTGGTWVKSISNTPSTTCSTHIYTYFLSVIVGFVSHSAHIARINNIPLYTGNVHVKIQETAVLLLSHEWSALHHTNSRYLCGKHQTHPPDIPKFRISFQEANVVRKIVDLVLKIGRRSFLRAIEMDFYCGDFNGIVFFIGNSTCYNINGKYPLFIHWDWFKCGVKRKCSQIQQIALVMHIIIWF